MKSISTQLATHFGEDCTTLAVIWKAKRRDGSVFGFTTHDEDITYDGADGDGPIVYYAATGFTNSAAETKSDMSVDNQEVTGFLDSSAIQDNDIRAGLWNNAIIELRIVNWADLTMGDLKVRKGTTGIIKMVNGVFTAEIRGLTQKLTTTIGATYGPLCRAELGSGLNGIDENSHWLCNIDITAYRQTGSVDSSPNAVTIVPNSGLLMVGSDTPTTPAPQNWFNDGIIIFTSGVLDNYTFEVKNWDGTTLTMFLPLPYQPAPGDTFTIEPGCSKTDVDCHFKFDNIVNFRGENRIPGMDLMMKYPNAK